MTTQTLDRTAPPSLTFAQVKAELAQILDSRSKPVQATDWPGDFQKWAKDSIPIRPTGKVIEVVPEGYKLLEGKSALPEVTMRKALLDPITSAGNIQGIPVMAMVAGAGIALLVGEVIDGLAPPRFMPPGEGSKPQISIKNVGFKALLAGLLWFTRHSFLGVQGALFGIAVLVADILQMVLPFNEWAAKIKGWFEGVNGNGVPTTMGVTYNYQSLGNEFRQPISSGVVQSRQADPLANALGIRG